LLEGVEVKISFQLVTIICVRDWENEASGGKITFSEFNISA